MKEKRIYRGFRDTIAGTGTQVLIYEKGDESRSADDIVRLPLKPSLKVSNHSPTGFEWGYRGSGPAQLALALLLEVDASLARRYYQRFKEEFVANFDYAKWEITHTEIENWIKEQK